jgi:hypothetical protein
MPTLRNTISELAASFASSVLAAIRSASLEEILAEASGRGAGRARALAAVVGQARRGRRGRLPRRSATDIAGLVDRIVSLLKAHPKGLRAEQIRGELGLEAKELPRPITEALSRRVITRSGQKRATTYFARAGGSKGGSAKGGKRGGASKGRRKAGRGAKGGARVKRAAPTPASTNGAPTV